MPSREKGALGYDVDDNAVRFSNYFHVLRELVHLSCGWLPLEASFQRKYMLGDHLHDDARSLAKVKRRLYELRNPSDYPGTPGRNLSELLDRAAGAGSVDEYISIAYGELKPALLHSIAIHLANLDPVADEPSQRLLRQIERRQKGHISSAGLLRRQLPHRDPGALSVDPRREPRPLVIPPPLHEPARDPGLPLPADRDPHPVEG